MSQAAPVLTGIPQDTVLGLLPFLMFNNNVTEDTSLHTFLLMIAWCVEKHRSHSDCYQLHEHLNKLVQWSKMWGMVFSVKKYNIISIINATKNSKICYQYTMGNELVNLLDTCV